MTSGLQEAIDALPDGVVRADADGSVRVVNSAAARMLGGTVETLLGAALDEVLLLRDRYGNTWTAFNRPYEGLPSRTGVPEQVWRLPDGTEALVTARLERERRGGEVVGVALSLRSSRGRARVDRERSDLVAIVAHELRSPLTGVKGFVQAMLNRWDKLSDEQKRLMLHTVNADADRLTRLIAELLDVARIDTGRLRVHPRPTDLSVLLSRVVAGLEESTARTIEYVADPATPQGMVDPDKFIQVALNLVENALRHGSGAVHVTLRPAPSPLPGHREPGPRLVVEDEGAGIPEQYRQLVFTKFWTRGRADGSGLGLYIVGGLVRAHQGLVGIHDRPGGGVRMVVDWVPATS